MPRARNIKPGFFENEVLAELPIAARLLFIGLWTLADREGRLEDRPKKIKLQLMPMDDVDVDDLLDQLERGEMIVRYEAEGLRYIQVLNFSKHQSPHCKEQASTIPAPDMPGACPVHAEKREVHAPPDSLNPDSLNPDSGKEQGALPRTPDRFDDFWDGYPVKREKKRARDAWKRKKLDRIADEILADIARRKLHDPQWLDGFIPHPSTYINGERWQDEIKPRQARASPDDARLTVIEQAKRMRAVR